MELKIDHPYHDTPYDVLSVPEDPKLGILPLDATHKAIKTRFPLLIKWWAAHPDVKRKPSQVELAKAVDQMGFPGRIQIDAFLCTTLDKAGDFDELLKQQETLPLNLHSPVLHDWENGLEPWQSLPSGEVALLEITVPHQHNYDDAQIDLYKVRFDS